MLYQDIYKIRFNEIEQRNRLWKILVNNFFQKYVDKNDTILDVPSGYCEFINNIEAKLKYAVDINPDAKKFALKKVKFIHSKASKITIKKLSIDKVFVSNFFEHITREEIIKTIKEFRRILRKDGQVLVLQPNIRYISHDYWMFFDHITPIDDRALTEIFSVYGFKLIKKIDKFLPYTTKSKLPQSNIFVKLYLKFPFLWPFFGRQSFLIYQK